MDNPYPSKTNTPTVADFMHLAYGDLHDLTTRCLNFRIEVPLDQMELTLAEIPGYNAFDPNVVWPHLEVVASRASRFEVGREGSPVIYVSIPNWTHQAIGHNPDEEEQRMLNAKERRSIAQAFCIALAAGGADEISTHANALPDAPSRWFDVHGAIEDVVLMDAGLVRGWWD